MFEQDMSFSAHVKQLCRTSFIHLHIYFNLKRNLVSE